MTENRKIYEAAIAMLPPKVLPGWNPHTRPGAKALLMGWRDMSADEAKEWLLADMGLT